MLFKKKAAPNNFQALLDRFRQFAAGSQGTDKFGTTRITTNRADPEIARIKETRFSPSEAGMTTLDTKGYQNSINKIQNVYSQLLAEGQADAQQALVPADRRDGFFMGAGDGIDSDSLVNQYNDPYADIKKDVRGRVDELLKISEESSARSTADRTSAVADMIKTLIPEGSPRGQYSKYQDLIQTPTYESFVGAGTSMDRAAAMAAANRAAMEARRPGNLAFFDELVQRMKG